MLKKLIMKICVTMCRHQALVKIIMIEIIHTNLEFVLLPFFKKNIMALAYLIMNIQAFTLKQIWFVEQLFKHVFFISV